MTQKTVGETLLRKMLVSAEARAESAYVRWDATSAILNEIPVLGSGSSIAMKKALEARDEYHVAVGMRDTLRTLVGVIDDNLTDVEVNRIVLTITSNALGIKS